MYIRTDDGLLSADGLNKYLYCVSHVVALLLVIHDKVNEMRLFERLSPHKADSMPMWSFHPGCRAMDALMRMEHLLAMALVQDRSKHMCLLLLVPAENCLNFMLRALWPAMQARYVDRRCMLDPSDFDMLKCAKHAIQLYALPDIGRPCKLRR